MFPPKQFPAKPLISLRERLQHMQRLSSGDPLAPLPGARYVVLPGHRLLPIRFNGRYSVSLRELLRALEALSHMSIATLALHARFSRPTRWKAIVEEYSISGEEWFAQLKMQPIDLAANLRTVDGNHVADIFHRVPAAHSFDL